MAEALIVNISDSIPFPMRDINVIKVTTKFFHGTITKVPEGGNDAIW